MLAFALLVLGAPAAGAADGLPATPREKAEVLAGKPLESGLDLLSLPPVNAFDANLADLRDDSGFAWESGFTGPGLDNPVHASVVWNGDLYVAGEFLTAGSQRVNRIARWDGRGWTPLAGPSGVGVNNIVTSLAVFDGALVVGGFFSDAGGVEVSNVARWDGRNWSAVGEGTNGTVYAMAEHDGGLIAGGFFTEAGGKAASRVARWDGSAWSPLGDGADGPVFALRELDGAMIAGGSFTEAGGVDVGNIARWDGTAWSPLGDGMNNVVRSLAVFDGALVAGGSFWQAGGTDANGIASWDGKGWSPLGDGVAGGPNPTVLSMAVRDGELIAGGNFSEAGGVGARNIARWDGSGWSDLAGGTTSGVGTMAVLDGAVYAGGSFTEAGGVIVHGIGRWTGESWSSLVDRTEAGLTSMASAMTVWNGDLIVGGGFTRAGGQTAWGIARWDGVSWSPLTGSFGTGIMTAPFDFIADMAVYEGDLIVAGQFERAGGLRVNHIARWDGHEWSSLAGGMDMSAVWALEIYDGKLIAAGDFTLAGGEPVNGIAAWDGKGWSPFGDGMSGGSIMDLELLDGSLIAGGSFEAAGGVPANNIARWDGTAWSPLGDGTSGSIRDLTIHDGMVVAGGFFGSAGGVPANFIAAWDGAGWRSLAGGMNGIVYSLGVHQGALIAGGFFSSAGGVGVSNIARWDGSAWSPLGSGTDDTVHSLLSYDADGRGPVPEKLAVSGVFKLTGGLANWRLGMYGPTAPLRNLTAAPGDVDFGVVRRGEEKAGSRTVTLASTGNRTVRVYDIPRARAPFVRTGGTCASAPFDLEPQERCTLVYQFAPEAPREYSQDLTIRTSGRPVKVRLAGEALPTRPAIEVSPSEVALDVTEGESEDRTLRITNRGEETLTWRVGVEEAGAAAARPATRATPSQSSAGSGRFEVGRAGGGPGAAAQALSGTPAAQAGPGGSITLSHSASTDIVPGHAVACFDQTSGSTTANQFLRTFTLKDFGITTGFQVVQVSFGIQALSSAQDITVNLYTLEGKLEYANLRPLGSKTVRLAAQRGTIARVPVGVVVPADATLVVEVAAPDLRGTGWFYPGTNAAGETAPTHLAAADCGLTEPTPLADLFFGDVHLVMSVLGREPVDCKPPSWLDVDPSGGTVGGGKRRDVSLDVDASDLEPGSYTANICLSSNDPANPLVVVPVRLTVEEREIELSAEAEKEHGRWYATLRWSGARGRSVDVYRDGDRVARTDNDGRYTDSLGKPREGARFTYRVCEAGGDECSDDAVVEIDRD